MDWIFDHLKFVIIAIFIIGSIVKSRLEGKGTGPDDLPDPRRRNAPEKRRDAPDQSYRKTPQRIPSVPPPLTRVNVPASVPSPPVSQPQTAYNYTIPGAAAAAQDEAARMLKHQQDLAAHLSQIQATKATTTGGAAATRARIAASKGKAKSFVPGPISIRARLRNPAEARRALVMREILDKPVGLR